LKTRSATKILLILALGLLTSLADATACALQAGERAHPAGSRRPAGLREPCSGCHYADTEKGLNGPGLEGLFRKPYLPSGMAANDARVTAVILHGRNMMPPWAIHCRIRSSKI
jgi:cytochrome c553